MSDSATAIRGPRRRIGRYVLCDPIAAGGMAVVHLGHLVGPADFKRTVAIKRIHPNLAYDPEFTAMFVDEARLAARIHHPNVVSTLDVAVDGDDVLLVMEYVHGEVLSRLTSAATGDSRLSLPVVSAILTGVLHGLHAAHEARDTRGEPLALVHRDVSPQNVLVGTDGIARVLDFGVAKAAGRMQTTREGRVKGKLAYMAPEQLLGDPLTRRADVYSLSVVAWELLTGRRLFRGEDEGALVAAVLSSTIAAPSTVAQDVSPALDALICKGLARDPAQRFETAREMALALERCVQPALASEVGTVVARLAGPALEKRRLAIAAMEEEAAIQAASQAVPELVDAISASGELSTRSQLSIHAAAATRSGQRSSRNVRLALLGASAVVAASTGFFLSSARSSPPGLATSRPAAPAWSAASDSPAASSATDLAAVPSAAASWAGQPQAPSTSTRRRVELRPAGPPASAGKSPPVAPSCNPPFTIDSIGRRIYRRECFR